ncbi:unnamed protein product, partial [Amoebophrya sp. A25]|eukprot:GSA25T00020457001.1
MSEDYGDHIFERMRPRNFSADGSGYKPSTSTRDKREMSRRMEEKFSSPVSPSRGEKIFISDDIPGDEPREPSPTSTIRDARADKNGSTEQAVRDEAEDETIGETLRHFWDKTAGAVEQSLHNFLDEDEVLHIEHSDHDEHNARKQKAIRKSIAAETRE